LFLDLKRRKAKSNNYQSLSAMRAMRVFSAHLQRLESAELLLRAVLSRLKSQYGDKNMEPRAPKE
jgi:hypothetical protein